MLTLSILRSPTNQYVVIMQTTGILTLQVVASNQVKQLKKSARSHVTENVGF